MSLPLDDDASSSTKQVLQSEDLLPAVMTKSVCRDDGSVDLGFNLLRTCRPLWGLRDRVFEDVRLEVQRRVHAMLQNPVCTDRDADDALQITQYMSYEQLNAFCRLTFVDFTFLGNVQHVNCFPNIMWSFENNFVTDDIQRLGIPQVDKQNLSVCEHHLKISGILALSRARSRGRGTRLYISIEYETPTYFDRINKIDTSSLHPRPQSRFVGSGQLLCELAKMYDHVDVDMFVRASTIADYVITPMQLVFLDYLQAHHKDYTANISLETIFNNPPAVVPASIHHLLLSEADSSNRYFQYVATRKK